MFQWIDYEKKDRIATITIDRPEARNALNRQLMTNLEQLLDTVKNDKTIWVLILTGKGKAFVAGADIKEQSVLDVEGGRIWGENGSRLCSKIAGLEIPTIAAVNGYALGGGCELAMACDIILASEKAKFGQPEVTLGITPGFSGTQRMCRRIGASRAKELIFSGKMIDAREARELGLINQVYEPNQLMCRAYEFAKQIAQNGPIAVRYSKKAIDEGSDMDFNAGAAIENQLFALCYGTKDQKEGMKAFMEKRKPVFQNK